MFFVFVVWRRWKEKTLLHGLIGLYTLVDCIASNGVPRVRTWTNWTLTLVDCIASNGVPRVRTY